MWGFRNRLRALIQVVLFGGSLRWMRQRHKKKRPSGQPTLKCDHRQMHGMHTASLACIGGQMHKNINNISVDIIAVITNCNKSYKNIV